MQSPDLKMGVTFAKSQSWGRFPVRNVCENITCRIGARMLAFAFSILQGILSGPVALVMSTSDKSLAIPCVCIARGGIVV